MEEIYAEYLHSRALITNTAAGKEIRENLWNSIWKELLKVDGKLQHPKRRAL